MDSPKAMDEETKQREVYTIAKSTHISNKNNDSFDGTTNNIN
jgi:hypothetical protein